MYFFGERSQCAVTHTEVLDPSEKLSNSSIVMELEEMASSIREKILSTLSCVRETDRRRVFTNHLSTVLILLRWESPSSLRMDREWSRRMGLWGWVGQNIEV